MRESLIMPKQIAFALSLVGNGAGVVARRKLRSHSSLCPLWLVWTKCGAGGDLQPDTSEDRMITPPPVSGQTYPIALGSEERSNYLRAGVFFTGAYTDNVLGNGANGSPVSDESYSVAPDDRAGRNHPAAALCYVLRAGIHFLSAHQFLKPSRSQR